MGYGRCERLGFLTAFWLLKLSDKRPGQTVQTTFGNSPLSVTIMGENYKKKHYALTCRTSDSAVLHCLRGLSEWAEKLHPWNITWGGTGEGEWKRSNGEFILHFSKPEYRDAFISVHHTRFQSTPPQRQIYEQLRSHE
jgi:hypothetical protein